MPSHDAMNEGFEEITVLHKPAIYTPQRLDRTTVPKGYHLYEVRHDDYYRDNVAQLANIININLWGSLVTRDEIELPCDGYLDVEPSDLNYSTGDCHTMNDFIIKYPLCA